MNYTCSTFEVEWNTHGFDETDLPLEEWEKTINDFMKIYTHYVDFSNEKEIFKKFNKEFDAFYPDIKENRGNQNVDGYLYGSFMAFRLNDALRAEMKKDSKFMKSDLLEPYIFMDGFIPILGGRLKNHDDWTMDFVLKPIIYTVSV